MLLVQIERVLGRVSPFGQQTVGSKFFVVMLGLKSLLREPWILKRAALFVPVNVQ